METGKNKKRPHLVLTESDSSEDSDSDSSEDSLEQLDTKVATHSNLQNGENENERKRRLDVFEFDEYDNIDEKRMKSSLKIEESDNNYEKRTKKKFDKTTSSSARKKELSNYSVKSRSKIDDDSDGAGELPISSLRQKFHSPPKKSHSRKLDFEDKKVSKSVEITKKNKSVSFSSESKVKVGKTTMKSEKVKSHEKVTPVRGSDLKNNRGSSTEKQKLREKLKNLLLDAGWKIDYRPRKSRRDYLDAVYMSPTGSAYWSIVKAYNAFRKHIDSDVEMEDIKKLTRRTQRKIERDMKMKSKKEDSDEDSVSDDEEDENSNFVAKKNIESMKRNIKRCTLLVRSSEKGLNSENERYIAYTGKRTLISWLIDSKIINLSEKVKYMNKKQSRVMQEGWVSRSGIHCSCCSKIISVSKFETHAGSKIRQPYQNIFLESGVSLLECLIEAWDKQEGSDHSGFHNVDIDGDDPNDDTCSICGDGGDLICCDSCPSTFHQSCLDIEMLPEGDWNCPNCICKFCEIGSANNNDNEDDTAVNAMLTCRLCERKYHESCCQKVDNSSDSSHSSSSFCEPKCHEIFDHLQKIIGIKYNLDAGFSWSLIKRGDMGTDESHRSFAQKVESNSKLAVALSVMDECFLPIVDRRSEINLLNSVVYNCGSNFSRLNFSGFYTVILERGDEVVAAASIRVRGAQLAEMPFIGTRSMYRRQGMCRRLLGAIESLLCSLEVKKLTIPAIAEHMHTWTAIFGFKPLDESHKLELKSMNMVVFPGIDMLQKFLVDKKTSEADIGADSGGESIPSEDDDHITNKADADACDDDGDINTSDDDGDINTSDDDAPQNNGDEMNHKSDVVGTSSSKSLMPLNGSNTNETIKEAVKVCESVVVLNSKADPVNDEIVSNTQSILDEAVKAGDLMVISDSKAAPTSNDDETISEAIVKDVDLTSQNGIHEDTKKCLLEVKNVNFRPSTDGGVDNNSTDDTAREMKEENIV